MFPETGFEFLSPGRLVFGSGQTGRLGALMQPYGLASVLVCCGPGKTRQAAGLQTALASLSAAGIAWEVFCGLSSDPSAEQVRQAVLVFKAGGHQALVAYGGGSPIDCAKAAALAAANDADILDLVNQRTLVKHGAKPVFAIPTTAGSGSEMSTAVVVSDTAARRKIGFSHVSLAPRVALVDPENQSSMPPQLTAHTGLDALTHLLESMLSTGANPLTEALNLQGISLVGTCLETAWRQPGDMTARSGMALASAMAGLAFSQTGLGMVHGFAHPLGAIHGLAHGAANAIMLPYVLAALAGQAAVAERLARAAAAFDGGQTAGDLAGSPASLLSKLQRLNTLFGIAPSLQAVGLAEVDLPAILAEACSYRGRPRSPRQFTDPELEELLTCAWRGDLAGAGRI